MKKTSRRCFYDKLHESNGYGCKAGATVSERSRLDILIREDEMPLRMVRLWMGHGWECLSGDPHRRSEVWLRSSFSSNLVLKPHGVGADWPDEAPSKYVINDIRDYQITPCAVSLFFVFPFAVVTRLDFGQPRNRRPAACAVSFHGNQIDVPMFVLCYTRSLF